MSSKRPWARARNLKISLLPIFTLFHCSMNALWAFRYILDPSQSTFLNKSVTFKENHIKHVKKATKFDILTKANFCHDQLFSKIWYIGVFYKMTWLKNFRHRSRATRKIFSKKTKLQRIKNDVLTKADVSILKNFLEK